MEQHLHTTAAAAGQGQRQLLQLSSSGASHQQHGSSSSAYSRHSSSVRWLHWNSSSSRSLAASPQQVLPRINLVGSGDVRGLGVRPDLQPSVKLYLGLSYEEFYDTLCRCVCGGGGSGLLGCGASTPPAFPCVGEHSLHLVMGGGLGSSWAWRWAMTQ